MADPVITIVQTIEAEYRAFMRFEREKWGCVSKVNLPPVGAWDGGNLYRQCQTLAEKFCRYFDPMGEDWLKARGFMVIGGPSGFQFVALSEENVV